MRSFAKKGYFFIIDAFIGSTIIFFALMIILSSGSSPTKVQYNYEMAEEYTSFIMNTKIIELDNPLLIDMMNDGRIKNNQHTIIEQADEFYYNNDIGNAQLLIKNLSEPLIASKYSFSYTIINGTTVNGTTINTTTQIYTRPTNIPLSDARIVISSRKITFLQINSTTMFGPAIMEIKIWL